MFLVMIYHKKKEKLNCDKFVDDHFRESTKEKKRKNQDRIDKLNYLKIA